jgi:hypothetical protein
MVTLQWLSIVLGLLAAFLWLWSSLIRLPTIIASGYGGGGGTAQQLGDKLRIQGRISAAAAASTALSVFCQAVAQAIAQIG